jgi:hypothetical protein
MHGTQVVAINEPKRGGAEAFVSKAVVGQRKSSI